MRLLVAEDETGLADALEAILTHAHYSVDVVNNGRDALEYARAGEYDGMILDIMMPGMSGLEVLRTLRAEGSGVPALFLTAKSGVDDRILGLDTGADDYIAKPFDMGELLARIRAMIRRREEFRPSDLTCGNLTLRRSDYTLGTPGAIPVRLSGREFQMMEMLMLSPGQIISPDTFLDRIWADGEAESGVVWVYVSNLRKKLRALGADVEIRSSRGLGYSIG
ncbi:MAG: response regulator transcription factor [Lachnospiraceae bacterium]|nr:response regulator transcription factor [Lachnospiraceae bacterium]